MKIRVIFPVLLSIVVLVIGQFSISRLENTLLDKFVPSYIEYSNGSNPSPNLSYHLIEYSALLFYLIVALLSGSTAVWLAKKNGWIIGTLGAAFVAAGTILVAIYALFLPNPSNDLYTSFAGITVKFTKINNLVLSLLYGALLISTAMLGSILGTKAHQHKNKFNNHWKSFSRRIFNLWNAGSAN